MEQTNHNFLSGGGQTGISDRMRELLSRAAQEHLSEQKTQDAITEEMRQRLEGMEWLLREVRERELATLTDGVTTVQAGVESLSTRPPEWAETLAEHIEQVGARVEPLAEMAPLRSDVTGLVSGLESVLGRLAELAETASRTAEQTAALTERLDGLASAIDLRLSRIDEAIESLSTRAATLENAVETVGERVEQRLLAALAEQRDALQEARTELGQRITETADALRQETAEQTAALTTALTEQRDALTTRLDARYVRRRRSRQPRSPPP